MMQNASLGEIERFSFGAVKDKPISGLEAVERHNKLMIFGKPGAGKTTFLKHLAVQCINGKFQSHRIPVFVELNEFAKTKGQPNLTDYIDQIITTFIEAPLKDVFDAGRVLILLDALDEINETDLSRVLGQIKQFAEQPHKNQYVITCRIAALEYTFEQFVEVEVADFGKNEIYHFSRKFFNSGNNKVNAEKFLKKLKDNPTAQELANSPLLLAMLCYIFKENNGELKKKRSDLYKTGIEILLKKWDKKTKLDVKRKQIHIGLSIDRKKNILSQIAWRAFEAGNYFFKQEDLESQINQFFKNEFQNNTDEQDLDFDYEDVLDIFEAHHGLLIERAQKIYSFSHLTFQEYFTARKIATSCNPYSSEDETLQKLAQRVTEKHWREVFLLVAEILPSADRLLLCMKHQIDTLLEKDDTLQKFLTWSMEQAALNHAPYKTSAIRAFYCSRIREVTLDLTSEEDLILAIDYNRSFAIDFVHALDSDFSDILHRAYELGVNLSHDLENNPVRVLEQVLRSSEVLSLFDTESTCLIHSALNCILDFDLETTLRKYLEQLKVQLPDPQSNLNILRLWWSNNGSSWSSKLQAVLILNPKLGHQWPLSETQDRLGHLEKSKKFM
jgi:predicted NACHT family NTPase